MDGRRRFVGDGILLLLLRLLRKNGVERSMGFIKVTLAAAWTAWTGEGD
jgi:hypothetical protein